MWKLTLVSKAFGASPRLRPGVRRWKARLYTDRPDWRDGSTQFADLVRRRLEPGMRILDLGAGEGKPGPVNFRASGNHVVGLDADRAIGRNPYVDHRVVGAGDALPLGSGSVDLVIADWVVEHFPRPRAVVAEVARVLRPGGLFAFRTGNLRHYSYAIGSVTPHWFHRLVANPARGLPRDAGDPYPTYYRMNTPRAIRAVMAGAGFLEEALEQVEPEPGYLQFSVPSFLLGVSYERIVNRFDGLKALRACLHACFRKRRNDRAEAQAPFAESSAERSE